VRQGRDEHLRRVGEREMARDQPGGRVDRPLAIVAQRYDAGVRSGEQVAKGMIAAHTRLWSAWSIRRRIELTTAAKTVSRNVSDMMTSTLCRPMAFMSM
jgi:hypothetical protein